MKYFTLNKILACHIPDRFLLHTQSLLIALWHQTCSFRFKYLCTIKIDQITPAFHIGLSLQHKYKK